MRARPLSLSIVAWLFVAVGVFGLVGDALTALDEKSAGFDSDWTYAVLSHLAAFAGGFFLLVGRGWARGLLVGWMAFYLILSAMHDLTQLLVHCVIFAPILFFLFRPRATAFLARAR